MTLPVFAIGMPEAYSELLFFTLEALGLKGEPMVRHDLFITADNFSFEAPLDIKLGENTEAYQLLASVGPNHFLPGYFFYSKAGSTLLSHLKLKKIIILRDPRDLVVGHMQAITKASDPLAIYYQNMLDDTNRLRASILGFTEKQSGQEGVMLQGLYLRIGFFFLGLTNLIL